jgi:uncharacterized protein (TIGR02145 family)
MRIFFFLALIGLFTSFSAQETITYPYNPDADNDQYVAVSDVLSTVSAYGSEFLPTEIQIDGVGLLQVIQELQNQLAVLQYFYSVLQQSIDDNALPDGIFSGDILIWNGTAWMPEPPPVDDCGVFGGDNSTCFAGCGDGIMHDGYDYSTVLIGDQCWFSENCRYLPEVSPSSSSSTTTPFYYVYGYEGSDVATAKSQANYSTYGVLYNWPALMEPGICPSGWHIPSDLEWQTMEISLGMSAAVAASSGWRGSPVGNYMKSTTGWNGGGNGTNSSGFNGLPGGYAYPGAFDHSGDSGYWWSSSAYGSAYSWNRLLGNYASDVARGSNYSGSGYSARCLRD